MAERTTGPARLHDRPATPSGASPAGPPTSAEELPGSWSPARLPAGVVAAGAAALAAVVLVVALIVAGGAPERGQPGLPDAGLPTGWALQACTLLFQLTAVVAVGCLLAGAVLAPSRDGLLHGAGLRALRSTATWAAAWAVSALFAALLSLSEIIGLPVADVAAGGPRLWGQIATLAQPRALLTSAAVAVVVAAYARWVRTSTGGWLLLGAALLGLTPVLFTGHSAQASDHNLATTSLVVHVLAATVWFGGLVGLVGYLRKDAAALAGAVPAFSAVALVCFTLVGASGVVNAWTRLGGSLDAWTSGYGLLVLAKVAAFAVLGAMGWAHRRRSMRSLAAGAPTAFLRLVGGEVLLMAATVGLAVALAATPTPAPADQAVVVPAHGSGHATLALTIEPFTVTRLVTQWQPDAIALAVAAIALGLYVRAVLAVTRAGRPWPVPRTAAFVAGLAVLVFATCGGLAVYAPALFSVHVARFLTLSLLVPLLLVLGAPGVLAERTWPAAPGSLRMTVAGSAVGRAMANPVNGFAAFVIVTYGLYATPLLPRSLQSVPAHLLASTAAVAVGLVLVSALLSADAEVTRGRRVTVVGALALFLVVFAVILATREALYAPTWFGELQFSWVEALPDQRRGAAVIAFGLQLAVPLLLLAVWFARTPATAPAATLPPVPVPASRAPDPR